MSSKRKTWTGRVYLGQDEHGKELYEWVGRFPTRRERDAAVARRRVGLEQEAEAARARRDNPAATIACEEYADDYIARMEDGRLRQKNGRHYKHSSIDTARSQLRALKAEFGDRTLASVTRHEAVRWAEGIPAGSMQSTVALFARAVDDELLERNPFRGLGRRVEGRRREIPPTPQEFAALLDACDALDDYALRMRAMIVVSAHSLMRPGEAMAIEWSDIDLPANRGRVARRLYRGRVDLPKSNRERTFALTPSARDALLTLPERKGFVFRNKTGGQLTQPTLTAYWKEVKARARLDFDFYLATKHYGCWYMKVKLGLPNHVIAAQAGWSESQVDKMVATYAHSEVGALDAIDAAWGAVPELPDAIPMQEGADVAL